MVPPTENGTLTRKIWRQLIAARMPPTIKPMNCRWAGDHVDTHGHAALVGRESIGQDGGRVGQQEGAAYRLDQPEDDNLHGGAIAGAVYQIEQDRADRKDGKTQVVKAHSAENIGDAAKGHQQRGCYHQITHQSPQQIVGFSGRQGVNPDAVEDGRQ